MYETCVVWWFVNCEGLSLLREGCDVKGKLTFTRELSVVLPRAFIPANNALDVLVLIGTSGAVLGVLRGSLSVDERDVWIFQGDGVDVGGQRCQVGGWWQRVESVGQRIQAGGNGVDERGLAPGAGHQSHGDVRRFHVTHALSRALMTVDTEFTVHQFTRSPTPGWAVHGLALDVRGFELSTYLASEVIGQPHGTL